MRLPGNGQKSGRNLSQDSLELQRKTSRWPELANNWQIKLKENAARFSNMRERTSNRLEK